MITWPLTVYSEMQDPVGMEHISSTSLSRPLDTDFPEQFKREDPEKEKRKGPEFCPQVSKVNYNPI